jgi:selenocysteine lyase/cysteine desulfurase
VRAVLDRHASLVPLGTRADRGIVTFTHQHVTPDVVAVRLAELGVATRFIPGAPTVTDGPAGFEPSVRLSPHHCTTAEEIAVLDEALSRLDA